jgi:hypothetical protein
MLAEPCRSVLAESSRWISNSEVANTPASAHQASDQARSQIVTRLSCPGHEPPSRFAAGDHALLNGIAVSRLGGTPGPALRHISWMLVWRCLSRAPGVQMPGRPCASWRAK